MHVLAHFKTITRHRHEVMKNCFRAGIGFQGLFHDLSKYSPAEFFTGAAHYIGTRSPNEGERAEYGYSKAWLHHKGRNRHHFEYWMDYRHGFVGMQPVKMPLRYVKEMFCDRVAASKIYQGANYTDKSPIEYFESGRARRLIHLETSALLEELLVMLGEKGEKETFKYIRTLSDGDYSKTEQ